ncbi:MAG: uracil-DNA glycosylase [Bdellovibrionales bacterium CG12_big_fil_rev_8_21_14_0_65_38_15]|nr:MAG: uracil-DNA glycosylase [Bdellovibrionales bacterium CG22_combo_CG10-13_8_21_14_all_38_13]PIQ52291.1 MAG: uracil-DNA glycosylase [Bdellovibrionales bacterium CG12_big_fil_rev_8_21_14_0_65_38_15]PIR29820.1 MAG: uracil-DNA glycosylase [Bdellovibrionales bacterium CG11_big_fil_rev_8_21_14_0_20_38_13]
MKIFNQLPKSWSNELQDFLKSKRRDELELFLSKEYKNKTIYPLQTDVFKALEYCSPNNVKVVILGQDPYHGEGQAHGLSFSVQEGVKIPPSLKNIYKELESDLALQIPKDGDLSSWASQGVLLLNNVLTVEKSKAGSHQKKGWEEFTTEIIKKLNLKKNIVFLLWGSPAQKKASQVCEEKHFVLKSVHPSPLSSYRGFFGCQHFSKTNEYLIQHDIEPINWNSINR